MKSPLTVIGRELNRFDLMEAACRSGFNNAYEIQYTDHSVNEPKTLAATPA